MITRSQSKQKSSPHILHVKVDKPFEIKLYSNASTGYEWTLKFPKSVQLISISCVPTKPIMPGTGGHNIYKFVATSTRKTSIQAKYARSWEKYPIESVKFDIVPS